MEGESAYRMRRPDASKTWTSRGRVDFFAESGFSTRYILRQGSIGGWGGRLADCDGVRHEVSLAETEAAPVVDAMPPTGVVVCEDAGSFFGRPAFKARAFARNLSMRTAAEIREVERA